MPTKNIYVPNRLPESRLIVRAGGRRRSDSRGSRSDGGGVREWVHTDTARPILEEIALHTSPASPVSFSDVMQPAFSPVSGHVTIHAASTV